VVIPSSSCALCCLPFFTLPRYKAQGRGPELMAEESPARARLPTSFQNQGHCTGRRGKEEVRGSFWYQGRKTLWEEVVYRGEAFCS
jgi:hypothetical protein